MSRLSTEQESTSWEPTRKFMPEGAPFEFALESFLPVATTSSPDPTVPPALNLLWL